MSKLNGLQQNIEDTKERAQIALDELYKLARYSADRISHPIPDAAAQHRATLEAAVADKLIDGAEVHFDDEDERT